MLDKEKFHIKLAKKGNKEAFGLLYDHYLPPIYRFILFKVPSKAEAEDLTHEVFLNAWKNMPRYKEKGFPFSSWLYQIAKNSIIDFYRTSKKQIALENLNVNEDAIKLAISTDIESLDVSLELLRLRKLILLLKPDYQDVIIMRFIEDLSPKEIAAVLNKNEGAVRLTQHRAIKELQSLYEKIKEPIQKLNDYGTSIKEV